MTAFDCGTSYRSAALKYLRSGRVIVSYARCDQFGDLPSAATVRILPALDGLPERVVLLDGTAWSCTCTAGVQTAARPDCAHVLAACQILGRGGPR